MNHIHQPTGADGGHEGFFPEEEELDLQELVIALWKRKYFIAAVTFLCAVAALASSYLFTRKYEADLVFVTVMDDGGDRGGTLGALASQFGGLAALGGISLSGSDRKAEYLAVLQSQTLIEQFITQNNLIPVLYADAWDNARRTWKNADPKKQPTTWTATQYFKSKVMRVKTENKTGISTLSMSWSDPDTAARWANKLVAMANEHVRAVTIEEAERNVAYLNGQLISTSVVGVQNSISTLLENEIKRIMLAKGRDQYAFRVIDPALSPERASFPNRIVWMLLAAFIGGLGSSAFVVYLPNLVPGKR